MKNLVFLFLLFVFAACKNEQPADGAATTADSTQTTPAPPAPAKQCYRWTAGRDTAWLNFTVNNGRVMGELDYYHFEKDSGHGMFDGFLDADMVTAVYAYTIEGSAQKEEIVFKIEGDKVTRANGELTEKNGVMVLKDKAKAEYNEVFTKADCPN